MVNPWVSLQIARLTEIWQSKVDTLRSGALKRSARCRRRSYLVLRSPSLATLSPCSRLVRSGILTEIPSLHWAREQLSQSPRWFRVRVAAPDLIDGLARFPFTNNQSMGGRVLINQKAVGDVAVELPQLRPVRLGETYALHFLSFLQPSLPNYRDQGFISSNLLLSSCSFAYQARNETHSLTAELPPLRTVIQKQPAIHLASDPTNGTSPPLHQSESRGHAGRAALDTRTLH